METESRSLISIIKDHNALDELLCENDGEVNETLEKWLEINEQNLGEKADGYKFYIQHLESRVDYFANIKRQAEAAKKVFENMAGRMEDRIRFAMDTLKVQEIKGDTYRWALSKATSKVVVENQEAIPLEYMKESIVMVPDMEKIEKALEADPKLTIEGVFVLTKQSLRCTANTKGKKKSEKVEKVEASPAQ